MLSVQLLVSRAAAALIRTGGSHGTLTTRTADDTVAVVAVGDAAPTIRPCPLQPANHFLAAASLSVNGVWFRADPRLHQVWGETAIRENALVRRETFAALVEAHVPTSSSPYPVITYVPGDDDGPEMLLGWLMYPNGAEPIDLELEPEQWGIAALAPAWPVTDLQQAHALVVGAGSIGSALAHALAAAGLGALTLADPDRLRWHNLVRHESRARHVGRRKVTALREDLVDTRPDTDVVEWPCDAVTDADLVRGLLLDCDIVVCAADGVAVRRVISHLARRATRTAVMACVLDGGAVGEVIRLRPWPDHGCLTCRRDHLVAHGGMDPEPGFDTGYGTGTVARPMTTVGSDLRLVGDLAARVTVSTLLDRGGHAGHRLPGEHAILSLRPPGDLAAPFDANRSLDLRWRPAPPPWPGCPTCQT